METYRYSSYCEYKLHTGKIIKESLERFKDINNLYIERVLESRKIEKNFIDYKEDKEYMNKEAVIEAFIAKNKIEKKEIGLEKKYLMEIAKELKDKCGITHKEIAKEFGVNRIKITRLINQK